MPILKRNGKTFSGTPTKVDTAKNYTTFDSADDKNPTTWSDVELLTSKEEQQSLFSKISTMFKNIRYLYKILGTTDISHYSDGTVTGTIKSACDKADANEAAIADVNSNLNKLVIYSNTVFLTAADGRIQIQTDYKPDKPYFLCCQFPNGFTGDIAQIDTNGLIVANYIYAPNATERFNGDLWVSLFGVFKVK